MTICIKYDIIKILKVAKCNLVRPNWRFIMTNNTPKSAATTTFSGKIEDISRFHTFGFVANKEGARAILFQNVLEASGFASKDLTADGVLKVETIETPKGPKVIRVISLDGVGGGPLKKPTAKKSKPKKKAEKKTPTTPLPVTLDMFINPNKVDCNKDENSPQFEECVYAIKNSEGVLTQYVIAKCEIVIRFLGKITLVDARADIGKGVISSADGQKMAA